VQEDGGLVEAVHVVREQVHHLTYRRLAQGRLAQAQGLVRKGVGCHGYFFILLGMFYGEVVFGNWKMVQDFCCHGESRFSLSWRKIAGF
jgi:hypothetical protein